MKLVRAIFVIAATALATSAVAQTNRIPVDQSKNWDVFMKLYPKRALAAGEQGLVGFNLTLDRNGHPTACQVTHSSGHKQLDEETCNLLLMHAVFQPPKDAAGNRLNLFRTGGVINWRIPGKAAPIQTPVQVAAANAPEKKICKRTPRTGTLAGFDRVCMTENEWQRHREAQTGEFDEIRRRGSVTCIDCQ